MKLSLAPLLLTPLAVGVLVQQEEQKEPPRTVPTGFEVSAATLLTRARALDTELTYAQPALERLAEHSLDRVTVELLMALARGRDEPRRHAAGRALVRIAERAAEDGFVAFGGTIAETLYLSALPEDVRERAYPLFMLLDNERARRHRRGDVR